MNESNVINFQIRKKKTGEKAESKPCCNLFAKLCKFCCLELNVIYSNLNFLYRIFVTLPATVASYEGCFSKLNIIKIYRCAAMRQNQLSNFAILRIERDKVKK